MVSCWVALSVQLLQLWASLHLAEAAAAAGAAVPQGPACDTTTGLTAGSTLPRQCVPMLAGPHDQMLMSSMWPE